MKAISINPTSAAVGGVLTVLTLFSAGAVQAPAFIRVGVANALEVQGIPRPQDMMVIREGEPLTVPAGRLFVLTGLGGATTNDDVGLFLNGAKELFSAGSGIPASVRSVPAGFSAPAGTTLEPVSLGTPQATTARAWGYLVDA